MSLRVRCFCTVATSVRQVPNHSVTCSVLSVSLEMFAECPQTSLDVFDVCPLNVFVFSVLVLKCGPKKQGKEEDSGGAMVVRCIGEATGSLT